MPEIQSSRGRIRVKRRTTTGTPGVGRLPQGLAAAAVSAMLAVVAGCGSGTGVRPLPATTPPDARCGGPGLTLGATQLQHAYGIPAMLAAGINGTGTVIADIVPYASPWAAADLAVYSRRFGLPVPSVQELSYGHVPAFNPASSDQAKWAQEGILDLEMAHVMAPRARLIYLSVPPESGSWAGEQYDQALAWLITRYRVDVVSYSAGTPEAWAQPAGYRPIRASRAGLQAAARAGVTVVASSGDFGPTEPEPDLTTLYPRPVIAWPASDPLVTAVGGTRLHLDAAGKRTSTDTAFTNTGGAYAGGAGLSAVFPRPSWQDGVRAVTGPHRGVADVSMDASPCSPVLVYIRINASPGKDPGWVALNGTSVATPLFAGIVADAAQIAGHPLGILGPALYQLHGAADGVMDITAGTTTTPGHPGYAARPGYDLPTGIGTVDQALPFVTALARQVQEAR
jgi:subtilase family serine protease